LVMFVTLTQLFVETVKLRGITKNTIIDNV
jgi:hypothetical protein